MAPTRIILDTDLSMGAGADVDDGFALALAHADPDLQLDLVTTVNGNTDLESATILTGLLLDRLNIPEEHTRFFRGAATPMIHPDQKREPAAHVVALKEKARAPSPGYAPIAMIEHILAHPGEITLVAIGPLTNVALALLLEPRIRSALKELVIMGGIFLGTMYARSKPGEFNVFSDPEAARTVLRSGVKQRWVGLDCTLRARLTRDDAAALQSSSSSSSAGFAAFAGEATRAYIDHQAERFPGRRPVPDSIPMHDPLAVAVVSRPGLCAYRDMAVSVITGDGEARGVMIADRLEMPDPPAPNCRIAVDIDVGAFRAYFFDLLQKL